MHTTLHDAIQYNIKCNRKTSLERNRRETKSQCDMKRSYFINKSITYLDEFEYKINVSHVNKVGRCFIFEFDMSHTFTHAMIICVRFKRIHCALDVYVPGE